MKYLTLDLIKKQLNITDFDEDDQYLETLGGAVENAVEIHIDDSLERLVRKNGGTLPLALQQAMLLLLGTYYANREHIAFSNNYEVGNSYTYLLDLFRNYAGHSQEDKENIYSLIYKCVNDIETLKKNEINVVGTDSVNVDVESNKRILSANIIDGGSYNDEE